MIAVCAVVVFSCKRDYPLVAASSGIGANAYLQVVHASPNFRKIFNQPDSLNVFLGSVKLNATFLKYGVGYPNGVYAAVQPGTVAIRLTVNGVTTPDSITVVTLQKTLVAGNYYTLVITDSINSPRDSSKIWLRDSYPKPTSGAGYFYLRLINGVVNGNDTVDLYSSRRNQVLLSKVKVDSTTPFTPFSTILNSSDTLFVRKAGTGNVLAKVSTVIFGDQQFYTAYYIGDTTALPAAKTRTLGIGRNK